MGDGKRWAIRGKAEGRGEGEGKLGRSAIGHCAFSVKRKIPTTLHYIQYLHRVSGCVRYAWVVTFRQETPKSYEHLQTWHN